MKKKQNSLLEVKSQSQKIRPDALRHMFYTLLQAQGENLELYKFLLQIPEIKYVRGVLSPTLDSRLNPVDSKMPRNLELLIPPPLPAATDFEI